MRDDLGLKTLLELEGTIAEQGDGHWVAIVAWRVPVTPGTPAGVRYSLTPHGPDGSRLLGCDNAHALKPKWKFNHAGRRLTFDHKHRHRTDRGVTYAFSTGYRLLADFFDEVDVILRRERGS